MSWEDWFLDDEMECVTIADIEFLQNLLERTTLEYEVHQFYKTYIPYIDEVNEYNRVKLFFYEHLIEPINAGYNYGQTEIKRKIKKEIF